MCVWRTDSWRERERVCVCGVLIAGEGESVCVWRTDSWRGRECVCVAY